MGLIASCRKVSSHKIATKVRTRVRVFIFVRTVVIQFSCSNQRTQKFYLRCRPTYIVHILFTRDCYGFVFVFNLFVRRVCNTNLNTCQFLSKSK